MTNELTVNATPQLQKISDFFETSGLVDLFVSQYGYQCELVCREGLAFAHKIKLHDLKESDVKKHFQTCTPVSKQQVFMSILAWGLPTDSRDLYYLYNDKGNLTCEPSYKGLIYIAEQNGLNVHAGLVFKGDIFEMTESAEGDNYTLTRADPFARKDIIGCFVFVENGEEKRVYTYSFEELEKSRQASRKKMHGQDSPAWLNYRNDMYLKCGVRKALKIAMAKISISNTIQALFDDEMQEIPSPAPVASQKTADFASRMEEAERIDEEFRKEQFAQLKEQFDYRNQENDL